MIVRTLAVLTAIAGAAHAQTSLIYFDENGGSVGPRGLYTLNPLTGSAVFRTAVPGTQRFFSITVDPANGTYYATDVPTNPTGLWTMDINTGAFNRIGSIPVETLADITIDPTDGQMYGQERNGSFRVYKIDKSTGAATLLGPSASPARCGLVASPAGDLYAFSIDGILYRISKSNGAGTLVGGASLGGVVVEDATWSPDIGLFFTLWDGRVFRVDPNTGAASQIHNSGLGTGLSGLVYEFTSTTCYADCDSSTGPGVLDIFDFLCFQNRFAASAAYACDCDTSTGPNNCDIFDFLCFQNAFAAGCP